MLGPFEVEYEGRRFYSNVALREFHIFEYEGDSYLVDIEKMRSHTISPRLATAIHRVASNYGCLVSEPVMLELRKLKLVAGEEEPSTAQPPAAEKKEESSREPEFHVNSIGLFVAQECNMRCAYCYGEGGKYAGEGMMSEETAFRAVDWLIANSKSAGKVNICFFGGEPLLNFSLMKRIVPYARKKAAENNKQAMFNITTNGSLLTDEVIAFLKDESIDPLISFDGPPELQNSQRPFKDGGGSYDTVYSNIQRLRKVIPHLKARATVYGDSDPFRIKEGMVRAGFTACCLAKASPVLLAAPRTSMPSNGKAERKMMAFYRAEIDGLFSMIRKRRIDMNCPPSLIGHMMYVSAERKRYYGCEIGKGMAAISVTGDIYPCHRFTGKEEMRMGNISDYRVEGLNDYYLAIVDRLPACKTCWARYYCGGGCFYDNMSHTGNMRIPDPADCRERRAVFEGLIHVCRGLDNGDREYLKEILKSAPARRPL